MILLQIFMKSLWVHILLKFLSQTTQGFFPSMYSPQMGPTVYKVKKNHFFFLSFFLEQTVLAVPWPVKTRMYWPNVPNFSSAKFNPVDPNLIATANLKNGVQLWDSRFPKRLYLYTFCTVN